MPADCNRLGLSSILEKTRTLRVRRTRQTFLQTAPEEHDDHEYSPDGEHDQDIVKAVVEILVSDHREEKDTIEDNDKGGDRCVATNPGPG